MGCIHSTQHVHPDSKLPPTDEEASLTNDDVRWVTKLTAFEAKLKYTQEGSLTDDADDLHLQFRGLLDDAVGRIYMEKYFEEQELDSLFSCWKDTLYFAGLTESVNIKSQLEKIVNLYIQPDSKVHGLCLTADSNSEVAAAISAVEQPETPSPKSLVWLQRICFESLFDQGYLPFRSTERYQRMLEKINKKINVAGPEDFEYAGVIGEGAFGVVVQCRKKTTHLSYAMKIQLKEDVVKQSQTVERMEFEKRAFASLKHPYIVELSYAFQTRTLVMLVMTLGTYKDLAVVIKTEGVLSVERARFYAAELTSALSYMHDMGLLYRDLKPCNILLQATGHIALVDFGSVTDLEGSTLQQDTADPPIFMKEYKRENALSTGEENSHSNSQSHSFGRHRAGAVPTSGLTYAPGGNTYLNDDERSCGGYTVLAPSKLSSDQDCAQHEKAEKLLGESDNAPNHDDYGLLMRAQSVIGTPGFMAPEIAVMMAQDNCERAGYTKAVDWWSLGCTVYKLITGKQPFRTENADDVMDDYLDGTMLKEYFAASKYAVLFEDVDYSLMINEPDAKAFIADLLIVNEIQRLGYGPKGSSDIKAHAFFASIDWNLLGKAKIPPPYVPPEAMNTTHTKMFNSLADCVNEVGKPSWMKPRKVGHIQRFFRTWNYASAAATVAEHDHVMSIMSDVEGTLSNSVL